MSDFRVLLRCVGEAVCANSLKALMGLVPMGGALYDIANDTIQKLREANQDDQLRGLIEDTASADPNAVKIAATDVAALVAADKPPEVRDKLAVYLAGVPAAIRRSLRRPSDPSGKSLPITFSPRKPEDLLQLLPSHPPRFSPGDRVPGQSDWELVELLGVGGFGEVWKARHAFFDGIAPVAFKFCLDPQARQMLLEHEAKVLNQVMRQGRHPGIVALLDASLSTDPPYLKYEYIDGGDLSGLVRDWAESPPANRWRAATDVILRLARILAFAHRLTPAIVHRDLKPGNILLPLQIADCRLQNEKEPSPVGTPVFQSAIDLKVADFGIGGTAAALALDEARQQPTARGESLASALRGAHTPLYASPQQVRGEPPSPGDDVHALGVIWYQLLTGDLLGGAPTGLWADELQEQGMPRDLVRILGACVSAKVERRPADAGALAEQMEAVLGAAKPVPTVVKPAPPPTASHRVDRLTEFLSGVRSGVLSSILDLSNRRIGNAGGIALASSPRLGELTTLLLSGCAIGDAGLFALMQSPHLAGLTRLELWDNHITDEGMKALAGCRFLENLQFLDLGRNQIGDAGIKALANSPHFARLGELLLVSNEIGDEGALAIASSPYLANLAWLKPLDNRMTAKGVDALQRAFGRRVRVM